MCNFEECPSCGEGRMSLDGGWYVWYCPHCRRLEITKEGKEFHRKLRKDAIEAIAGEKER